MSELKELPKHMPALINVLTHGTYDETTKAAIEYLIGNMAIDACYWSLFKLVMVVRQRSEPADHGDCRVYEFRYRLAYNFTLLVSTAVTYYGFTKRSVAGVHYSDKCAAACKHIFPTNDLFHQLGLRLPPSHPLYFNTRVPE